MAPLIVLTFVTLGLLAAGALGAVALRPLPTALRGGLAAMFLVTGTAHFVGLRQDLVDMVPPALPAPEVLVTITGVLELAGAIGLLWKRTAAWAAGGLSVLLVAMFPANVYAALEGISSGWESELAPRTVMQGLFLAATITVFRHERERGAAPAPVDRADDRTLQPASRTSG